MNAKTRKYVIPNIPYLFVFWICLKLGTAYRIADGVNIVSKLIGIGNTINIAISDLTPGLIGFDWLVGAIGAVLFRVVIYYKVRKAKKYRKDVEYGSARWGA